MKQQYSPDEAIRPVGRNAGATMEPHRLGESPLGRERKLIVDQTAVWRHRTEATPELLEAYAKWRAGLDERFESPAPKDDVPASGDR